MKGLAVVNAEWLATSCHHPTTKGHFPKLDGDLFKTDKM